MTTWDTQCTYGTVLKLNRDTGLCDRFLRLDIKKHKETVAMIKTVHQNYEGYAKRDIKEAILEQKEK